MSRNFHSDDERTERRLNSLYWQVKTTRWGQDIALFGALWNFVSFVVLGATTPGIGNLFALLTLVCVASYFVSAWAMKRLRAEWDKLCPCPACQARREIEKRIRKGK